MKSLIKKSSTRYSFYALLLTCSFCYGQSDSSAIFLRDFENYQFTTFKPKYKLIISNNDKRLEMDFNSDTLKLTGDMEYDEAAKRFLQSIHQAVSEREDSLRQELNACRKKYGY